MVDQVAELVVHGHVLEQAGAALEAGVVAGGAAAAAIELLVDHVVGRQVQLGQRVGAGRGLLAAILADLPHQPLGQDGLERGGEQERRHAHVAQPRDRAGGVVGVQRAEHHVPGQRRLHGDFGRLQVADLADQDLVRVLPQDRPQALGERVADRRVDGHLHDAVDVVLDRVLGGDQLVLDRVQLVQRAVERGRLAGAGRTGDQHDAVGLADHLAEGSAGCPAACRRRPDRA